VTLLLLAYLLLAPRSKQHGEPPPAPREEIVKIVKPGLIRVQPGSPFDKNMQLATVRKQSIHDPVMTVTGRVIASLRPAKGNGTDYWQFDSPEILAADTDWEKARADIAFAETQLAQVKQLSAAQLDAQKQVVARLEKLVAAGTDTPKELAAEKANLIQVEINGRKEIHEAEMALRTAKRDEVAAAKQLQHSGLDPNLLRASTSDIDIVMADVPESRLSRVKDGQGCEATFFGIPNEHFTGNVSSIAPSLSKERRSLRVLFKIADPDDKLRPGMFAEIGLGTDARQTLLAPADSILHVGRSDYALVADGENTWRIVEVQVGEPHNGDVEILDGLKAGDPLIGKGAILFKPLVARSLQMLSSATAEDRS
jgi:hypothetical protein